MRKAAIKAVIIDDEKMARDALRNLVEQHCATVEIIGEADSKVSGQSLITEKNPDLIFLDVEMPFGSGFDLLHEIAEVNAEVVFTTAHDQYALRAIKISALDYLLKPIKKEELTEAVNKFRKKDRSINREALNLLAEQLVPGQRELKRLGISSPKGFNIINVDDIMYCEADGNYTMFKLSNNDLLMACKTLKEYENILSPRSFIRTHHKYIVNVNFVKKYIKGRGGSIIMTDETPIDVSQSKRTEVLRALGISF